MLFRCKRSGNVIELKSEVDILAMKDHPAYEEVKYGLQDKKEQETAEKRQVLKLKKHERAV